MTFFSLIHASTKQQKTNDQFFQVGIKCNYHGLQNHQKLPGPKDQKRRFNRKTEGSLKIEFIQITTAEILFWWHEKCMFQSSGSFRGVKFDPCLNKLNVYIFFIFISFVFTQLTMYASSPTKITQTLKFHSLFTQYRYHWFQEIMNYKYSIS